jgi:hypothetical protein
MEQAIGTHTFSTRIVAQFTVLEAGKTAEREPL